MPSRARPPRSRWWPKPPKPRKQRRADRPSFEGKEKGPAGHCRAALFRSDLLGGRKRRLTDALIGGRIQNVETQAPSTAASGISAKTTGMTLFTAISIGS